MRAFQATLFGRFSLTSESSPIPLADGSAHLLAYLALSQGRLVSRSRVAGVLWPDLSERRAKANLSTTIWRLRRALLGHGCPADVIHPSTDSLGLDMASCDVDVDTFVRATVSHGSRGLSLDSLARAVHALDLYKGDLLEDWDVEWCRLEREELRKRYLHTLHALSEGFEQRGRNDLAILYAKQAAQADPLNEAIQRTLMGLLYRTGDKASAVTQFNQFAHLAKLELGVEPDRETIALVREIRRPSSLSGSSETLKSLVPISIRPERIPLVGRDIERLELNALLDSAVAAKGGGVLLVGEAGLGKSKLADWVMEEWAARGGAAGRGRCIEFNDPVPYQPLLDALGDFVDEGDLTGFVSGDGPPSAHFLDETVGGTDGRPTTSATLWPPGKLRLFTRLRSCLEDASRRRPILIVVEDLQWADAGTADFLVYLLEHARNMRLVLLLTSRPIGVGVQHTSLLGRLSRHSGATLRLSPLSMVETTRLVKSLLDRSEPELAKWVYAETEGNPLFVVETLRLIQRQGDIETSLHKALGDPDRSVFSGQSANIPEGVRSAVEQRLALIEPASLRIAQSASVLGRSFDEDLLGMIVGTSRNRLLRAIGHLLREGIFEREGAGYRFSHDKIRAICYQNLATRTRRTYHSRTAAALVQMPDVPIHRLAWHQLNAGLWTHAAISWEQAGDHARQVYAYEEALRAYGHAITCVRRDTTHIPQEADSAEIALLVKSDEVLAILGKPEDRRAVLERMSLLCRRTSRKSTQATWLIRSALLEEHVGNLGLAAKLARRAWSISRNEGDRLTEVEALRVLAWAISRGGRYRRSLSIWRVALRRMDDSRSLCAVTIFWQAANAYLQLSDYDSTVAYLDRARTLSIELGMAEIVPILTGRAIVDRITGEVQASRKNLLDALRIATETSEPIAVARVRVQLVSLDALEGRLGHALRGLREATAMGRTTGYIRIHASCLNEVAYGIGRMVGNYQWALKASGHALDLCSMLNNKVVAAIYKDSQARVLLDEGRVDEAMVAANEALRLHEHDQSAIGPFAETLALRGAISAALGSPAQAISDLEAARRRQVQIGERLSSVDTLTHLASAYARLGDANRALEASGEALRLLAEINHANFQPQRVFWHHYLILEQFNREPRLPYLKRAVEFIEAQAATLSKAQARRFKRDVRLNREILEAWERHKDIQPEVSERAISNQVPLLLLSAAPATDPAYAPLVFSA